MSILDLLSGLLGPPPRRDSRRRSRLPARDPKANRSLRRHAEQDDRVHEHFSGTLEAMHGDLLDIRIELYQQRKLLLLMTMLVAGLFVLILSGRGVDPSKLVTFIAGF